MVGLLSAQACAMVGIVAPTPNIHESNTYSYSACLPSELCPWHGMVSCALQQPQAWYLTSSPLPHGVPHLYSPSPAALLCLS